jgi:hypothetical protein
MSKPNDPPDFPPNVTFFEPLEMYLSRQGLIDETQRELTNLINGLKAIPDAHPNRPILEQARRQREAFLKWLRSFREPYVFLALYPLRKTVAAEPNPAARDAPDDDPDIGDAPF